MKKLILLSFLTALSITLFAGNGSEKIHSEYGAKEGVASLSFNKQMMDAIDLNFNWQEAIKNLKGDFESFKILVINDSRDDEISSSNIRTQLNKLGYHQADLSDETSDVEVYVDTKKRKFNDSFKFIVK